MRPLILVMLIASFIGTAAPCAADPTGGYVSLTPSGCDYFLTATKRGFVLFEWFSGAIPDKDDFIVGNDQSFYSYGFHNVYDKTQERGMRVYVEDYDLDSDAAIDQLSEHCH